MKPSERIVEIVDRLRKDNPFAYPYEDPIDIALAHISAIQEYLDEEYAKNNKLCNHEPGKCKYCESIK